MIGVWALLPSEFSLQTIFDVIPYLPQDYDLDLEDVDSSEYTSEEEGNYDDGNSLANTGRTSLLFGIAEPLTDRSRKQVPAASWDSQSTQDDGQITNRQLVIFGQYTRPNMTNWISFFKYTSTIIIVSHSPGGTPIPTHQR